MKIPDSFSTGYFNISGLHRKWLGCKIPHLKNIVIHDITVVAEICLCNHNKDIEGYSYFSVDPQKDKSCRSGRSSGGMIFYYTSFLEPYIKALKRENLYAWVKITCNKTLFTNINSDIFYV